MGDRGNRHGLSSDLAPAWDHTKLQRLSPDAHRLGDSRGQPGGADDGDKVALPRRGGATQNKLEASRTKFKNSR